MNFPRGFRITGIAVAALLTVTFASVASANDATPPSGCTGPASATWLNVTAEGLRNGDGLLAITLYADDNSKFLAHHGSLYVGRAPAIEGTMHACIFLPHPGVYALALYHDENANQKFDRNAIGFPKEGFGFSNNPPTFAGLPSFPSVRLNVSRTGLTTHVQIKYP